MKFRIPFVALGLLALSCAPSYAQGLLQGDVIIPDGSPAKTYNADANGTATVSGQSKHTLKFTNTTALPYNLVAGWTISLNLGGVQTSQKNDWGKAIPAGDTWSPPESPASLSVHGDFSPGTYNVSATTELFCADIGVQTNGNPTASRGFQVVAKGTHGVAILVEATLEKSLIGVVSD